MNKTITHKGVPTAHITRKKSRLKVYNGHNVFLNDGDNFEFEIHNPKQHSVLAKIKLNGEYISSSGIIIKPGQRVFLERFLDSNNKFEYSTYKVKNNEENRSAIDLNGDVRIEFYDQQLVSNNNLYLNGTNWNPNWSTITTGSPYYGNMTYTTSSIGCTVTTSSAYINTSLGRGFANKYEPKSLGAKPIKKSIETGRVEKGEESDQKFTYSNDNFSCAVSKYYDFKILPTSQKSIDVTEIRQYCTECGVKIKTSFKFCPSCGNKI
jgi:hypothetical protein